VGILLF